MVTAKENQTAVTTVLAIDSNGNAVTYAISGGVDAAKFTLNPVSGVLEFIAAPDYELPTDSDKNNVYDVQVSASDGSLTDTQTLQVSIADVAENQPPSIVNPSSITYSENASAVVMDINTTHKTESEGKGLVYSLLWAGG